jgi:hypothetical protein
VEVWEGYVASLNGMFSVARAKLLAGLVRRPMWLKNKGILKAVMRSMLAHKLALCAIYTSACLPFSVSQ